MEATMRRWAAAAVLLPLTIMLAACGTSGEPTQADLRATWESRNVAPVNYKSDILAYMRTYLNDPSGVRNAAVAPPARKVIPGDPADRFISCVRYTAKTSTGQYGAGKTGFAVYANGKLDRFVETPVLVREVCREAAFEPFPELQQLKR
jgi:hypothetical protein